MDIDDAQTNRKPTPLVLSARKRTQLWKERLRLVLLAIIILFSFIFGVSYFIGKKRVSVPSTFPTPVQSNNPSFFTQEPFHRTIHGLETGKIIAQINANKAEIYADGRKVLNGINNTNFLDDEGRTIRLNAGNGYISKDMAEIIIEDQVELHINSSEQEIPFVLSTEKLVYHRDKKKVVTDKPVQITGKGFKVTGNSFMGDLGTGFFYVENETITRLIIPSSTNENPPIYIYASEMQFNYRANMAFYIGSPEIKSGKNSIKGQEMTFELDTPNRRLMVEGNVLSTFYSQEGWNPLQGKSSSINGLFNENRGNDSNRVLRKTIIKSRTLIISELTDAYREIKYRGNVEVESNLDKLKSSVLTIFLSGANLNISGIIAEGDTWFLFSGYEGEAGKVIYHSNNGKLVMTQGATIKWGNHSASAEEILFPPRRDVIVFHRNVKVNYFVDSNVSTDGKPGKMGWSLKSGTGPIVILADEAQYMSNENKIHFEGDVEVKRGNLNVLCDFMDIHLVENGEEIERANFLGSVRMVQGADIASSESGILDFREEKLELSGKCNIVQGQDTIIADKILMDSVTGKYIAEGNVVIKRSAKSWDEGDTGKDTGIFSFSESSGGFTVTCQFAEHDVQSRTTWYKDKVVVTKDDLTLKSDYLETILDSEDNQIQNLIARGNVHIKQQNIIASGKKLLYNKFSRKLILTGDPAVVNQADRVDRGKRILIYTDEKRIFIDSLGSGSSESIFYPGGQEKSDKENRRTHGKQSKADKQKSGGTSE